MAYVGLVPSEHSSGSSQHRGRITKTGNRLMRHVLARPPTMPAIDRPTAPRCEPGSARHRPDSSSSTDERRLGSIRATAIWSGASAPTRPSPPSCGSWPASTGRPGSSPARRRRPERKGTAGRDRVRQRALRVIERSYAIPSRAASSRQLGDGSLSCGNGRPTPVCQGDHRHQDLTSITSRRAPLNRFFHIRSGAFIRCVGVACHQSVVRSSRRRSMLSMR